MKVRYSETALRELDEIFAYIYERNRSAAVAVLDRIERLSSLIGEVPLIGHLTDEEGVRMMPVAIPISDFLCSERQSR
jgi:toxin ParE1/3/4